MLQKRVQVFENVRRNRAGEDAPIAQSPTSPLHSILEPSDKSSLRESFCRKPDKLCIVSEAVAQLAVIQYGLNLLVGELGPQER